MGHAQVFTHVGDQVRINAPNGRRVAPLITGELGRLKSIFIEAKLSRCVGTFGSADFIHSLLGEATDHIVSFLLRRPGHDNSNLVL